MGIVALPKCEITLKAQKPPKKQYPKELKSIGDHIKKKRLDLDLLQKEVAEIIGVQKDTICNWENNRFSPKIHLLPKIYEFLGYVSLESPNETIGDRIKSYRKKYGLSQRKLAKLWGVDQSTILSWEKAKHKPNKMIRDKISKIFAEWSLNKREMTETIK